MARWLDMFLQHPKGERQVTSPVEGTDLRRHVLRSPSFQVCKNPGILLYSNLTTAVSCALQGWGLGLQGRKELPSPWRVRGEAAGER